MFINKNIALGTLDAIKVPLGNTKVICHYEGFARKSNNGQAGSNLMFC
jgi:hypothetical protein